MMKLTDFASMHAAFGHVISVSLEQFDDKDLKDFLDTYDRHVWDPEEMKEFSRTRRLVQLLLAFAQEEEKR